MQQNGCSSTGSDGHVHAFFFSAMNFSKASCPDFCKVPHHSSAAMGVNPLLPMLGPALRHLRRQVDVGTNAVEGLTEIDLLLLLLRGRIDHKGKTNRWMRLAGPVGHNAHPRRILP